MHAAQNGKLIPVLTFLFPTSPPLYAIQLYYPSEFCVALTLTAQIITNVSATLRCERLLSLRVSMTVEKTSSQIQFSNGLF